MMINAEPTDNSILKMQEYIKSKIEIPSELEGNFIFENGALGTLFLDFNSGLHKKKPYLNSRHRFSIHFITHEKYYNYCGNNIGYTVAYFNVPKIIGVKKLIDKDKVIAKINKYIKTNKQSLIDCIEN